MALGSTRPLTEMSTRNFLGMFLGVKGGRRVGLTTLPPSMNSLESMGSSTSHKTTGLYRLLQEWLYLFNPYSVLTDAQDPSTLLTQFLKPTEWEGAKAKGDDFSDHGRGRNIRSTACGRRRHKAAAE
jgi:hypothetical protein